MFQHPAVAQCVATPIYDELRGEEVGVCVILNEGIAPDADTAHALFDFCREKLVYYKTPAYYMFRADLPMTASQKIQRGEIKALAARLAQAGDCIDLRERKRKK